jgi:hypothetical protein
VSGAAPSAIAGQRQLSHDDVAAINDLKAEANECGAMLEKLQAHPGIDQRALAIAKTELQTGFMWAFRAVARPTSF